MVGEEVVANDTEINRLQKREGEIVDLNRKDNFMPSPHLRSTISALIAHRVKLGASTPIGRRLSMLVEQIQRDGGQYVHANHGAGDHSKGAM